MLRYTPCIQLYDITLVVLSRITAKKIYYIWEDLSLALGCFFLWPLSRGGRQVLRRQGMAVNQAKFFRIASGIPQKVAKGSAKAVCRHKICGFIRASVVVEVLGGSWVAKMGLEVR